MSINQSYNQSKTDEISINQHLIRATLCFQQLENFKTKDLRKESTNHFYLVSRTLCVLVPQTTMEPATPGNKSATVSPLK